MSVSASVSTPEEHRDPSLLQVHEPSVLVIRPSSGWVSLNLREVWAYRELLFILMWRDVAVRYKQTALGVLWALLQPVLTMAVFTLVFGRMGNLSKDVPGGIPYSIYVYTALLPWQLFAKALVDSSGSLLANRNLVTKVYFPRLILPFSAVLAGLVDFAVAFVLLLAMMAYWHLVPTLAVIALPALLVLAVMTALAMGLWLSALTVRYRDAQYLIPFLTQFWFFATPIVYPISRFGKYRALAGINPMAGVVEGFRWALLGQGSLGAELWVSLGAVAVLLVGGLAFFRRVEKTFADLA